MNLIQKDVSLFGGSKDKTYQLIDEISHNNKL